jgi:phosphoribosylformimino-5-aminoimidazole carboxamide ribotide isomerase
VSRICRELPCRVGGGIRSIERAREVIALGARKVILGSALFRDSRVDVAFASQVSDAIGADRLIAAIDAKGDRVVIHGWRTALDISPSDALAVLEPFVSEFLYTHVDREGLMQGTDIEAIRVLRRSTSRALTAAGGITTQEEIDELDAMRVDAVVGMAIYTGKLKV